MLPENCQSKEDGICRLPKNSCVQCADVAVAMKFSEWHERNVRNDRFLLTSDHYDALSERGKKGLDKLIESYIGELVFSQARRERKNKL